MIFKPGNTPLKKAYPVLREYDEFKSLTDNEMKFVWWYSCKSSPYYHLNPKDRLVKVFVECKNFIDNMKPDEYEEYASHKFPSYILAAMDVMGSFIPQMRDRASGMTDKILSDLEWVVQQDIKTETQTDGSDLKNLIDLRINIAKNLPLIVQAAENGYGTKSKDKTDTRKQLSTFEED